SSCRCVGRLSTPGAITLRSRSLVIDTAHEVCSLPRWVAVSFPPVTIDRYAGVYVYHCWPSPFSEKCGWKKYGWLKSSRTPRSSDDQRTCAPAERAPPGKFT